MNREFLLTVLIVLTVALSVSTIYASEVNITDTYTCSSDDAYISVYNSNVDNDSSNDNILKSENSDTLSTNADSDLLKSDNNANVLTSTSENSLSATKTISTSKTVTSKDITKYYKGSAKYTATFLDKNGNVLKNTNVKVNVNSVTYTIKTDTKGVASLAINLKPGTYKIVATNPKTGYSLTNTIQVLSTINAEDISKVYTDGRAFYATFLKNNGKALANKAIKFKLNGVTYTRTTNSDGVASLSITYLAKGTHKIISYNTDGLSKTNTINVVASTSTVLKPYTYTYLTSDTQYVKVKLLNKFGYAPGQGKDITFKVNGKSYYAKTNSNGIAYVKIPTLKAGTYTVSYSYGGNSFYTGSSASNKLTIIPTKTPTLTVKSPTTIGYGSDTPFKVALTSGNVPLAGKVITINVKGTNYEQTTDSNGIASLPLNLAVGKYTIKFTNKADSKIDSKTGSTTIDIVKRTKTTLTWKSSATFNQGTNTFSVLLLDSKSKAISGATVNLVADSKNYTAKTGSDGYANFNVAFAKAGKYTVKFSFDGDNLNLASSGSKAVTINNVKTVSLKSIISASTTLKTTFASTNKFPDKIAVDGITFTMPEFLYLMCQAIPQIGNSNNAIAYITGVTAPSSSSGDHINNVNLYKNDYITVANNVGNYIKSNKQAPTYASSTLGKIGYNELLDAFTRVVAYYGTNDIMPNYVTIKAYNSNSGSSSESYSQTGSGLNEKNTVSNLVQYLKSSTNCQVNNTAIKKVVDSLTSGLSSTEDKAKVIYNYVRDSISYTFYYDTRYGAVGTLNAKTGNCVDQAHLLVAMYRTAGIPARYVHGASCTFSSGTYGHVWTQVLIGNNWVVADPTSSRNSFGKIVNWNTNSFTLKGIYSGIQF